MAGCPMLSKFKNREVFVLIYEVNDHEQALLQSNSTVVVATETEKFFPGSSAINDGFEENQDQRSHEWMGPNCRW